MNLVARLGGGEHGRPLTAVTLSRSNLTGLLKQLDDVRGTREPAQIMRRVGDNGLLIVVAEEDDAHYGERTAGVSDGSDVR